MIQGTTTDIVDRVRDAGRHWGSTMVFGIISFLIGVLVLAWPRQTIAVLAVLFGIHLVVTGIFRFAAALGTGEENGSTRVLLALLGVLSFIVGIYAIRHILLTVAILALLLGIYWIVNGVLELFTALSHRAEPNRGTTITLGLCSIGFGILVLVYPEISLLTLAIAQGMWLAVFGIVELILAFRLRSAAKAGASLAPSEALPAG